MPPEAAVKVSSWVRVTRLSSFILRFIYLQYDDLWTVSAKAGFGAHLALESETHLGLILYWTSLESRSDCGFGVYSLV